MSLSGADPDPACPRGTGENWRGFALGWKLGAVHKELLTLGLQDGFVWFWFA